MVSRTKQQLGQMDLFPPAVEPWSCPDSLPDWTRVPLMSLDTETKDIGLNTGKGPGYPYRDHGHIVGFSICNGEESYYFPIRHPDSNNFDIDSVYRWWKDHLFRPNGRTIFHHANYDIGWIFKEIGVTPPSGSVDDTLAMGVMLDEQRYSYSLQSLCKQYGIPGKDRTVLKDAAKARGLDPGRDLWQLPAEYVGAYGESDAVATFNLYQKMWPEILEQDLEKAYRLECDLIEVCVRMRMRGIRINEEQLEGLYESYIIRRDSTLDFLSKEAGIGRHLEMTDIVSGKRLSVLFDNAGLSYPLTNAGSPSFESGWLEAQNHWLPQSVAMTRKYDSAATKFLDGYIGKSLIDGRLHAEIHQLRDIDEERSYGGTRSYRFSYSNPPLQQMPARDPDIGRSIRTVFEPEEGEQWLVSDMSQQEPRFTVHYAFLLKCPGSDIARNQYAQNPFTDYHQLVADMAQIDRKPAKIINLGLAYGMQKRKLARSLGLSDEDAEEFLENYHTRVPYMRPLTKLCSERSMEAGYIRLVDGARCRFNFWRPSDQWKGPSYALDKAKETWPDSRLVRADTHKAMNRLIQGSSARQIKKAMLDCYKAGYLPLLQMHDDLDFSIADPNVAEEIGTIMCDSIPLSIPMAADLEIGPNWGEVKEVGKARSTYKLTGENE